MIRTSDKYVNDIIINGDHINRIYLNGDIYWGNEPVPPAPTKTNTVKGKGVPNTVYNNALRINSQDYSVTTNAEGYFTLQLDTPVYNITGGTCDIFYNTSPNTISELDLRDLVYDNENGVDLLILTNIRQNKAALTDVWFDFTDLTNITMFSFTCRMNITNNFYIHGLGTLNAVFPQAPNANTVPEGWSLREGSSNGYWNGTLDIRGIDTRNAIDWPRVGSYPADAMYGTFYNWPGTRCHCDTLIIGNLEWPYDYFRGWNYFKTLYCTSTTPPSLDRTGQYGITAKNYISAMSALTTIYVPTGCLSAYQNASIWSNYANKMSELDAPDPLTI